MKALVIGSGGREHAIAWGLSRSPLVERVFVSPGNGGTHGEKKCANVSLNSFKEMASFAEGKKVGLTVVGPEQPLAEGIAYFFDERGLSIVAPSAKAAMLESSKAFAKELMKENNIPTASFQSFTDLDEALSFIEQADFDLVVKADGLAAGKGVIVCSSKEEASAAVKKIMVEKVFGSAGNKVVLEERLYGEEASFIALTDSKTIVPLLSSQDHKPAFDGDRGPNSGGMGACAPTSLIPDELSKTIFKKILRPAVDGLKQRGILFKGVLYAGLMISNGRPKVLEFNVRMGDPETQPVLSLLETDFFELLSACAGSRLKDFKSGLQWREGFACTVVMASGGYPGNYEKGKEIAGIPSAEKIHGVKVFHAGTKLEGKRLLTSGGRVLNVNAARPSVREAVETAYSAVKRISFENVHYRKDIGFKELGRSA